MRKNKIALVARCVQLFTIGTRLTDEWTRAKKERPPPRAVFNSIKSFEQAAAFRFLRHPSRPNAKRHIDPPRQEMVSAAMRRDKRLFRDYRRV
jgi:hypothetical protein